MINESRKCRQSRDNMSILKEGLS